MALRETSAHCDTPRFPLPQAATQATWRSNSPPTDASLMKSSPKPKPRHPGVPAPEFQLPCATLCSAVHRSAALQAAEPGRAAAPVFSIQAPLMAQKPWHSPNLSTPATPHASAPDPRSLSCPPWRSVFIRAEKSDALNHLQFHLRTHSQAEREARIIVKLLLTRDRLAKVVENTANANELQAAFAPHLKPTKCSPAPQLEPRVRNLLRNPPPPRPTSPPHLPKPATPPPPPPPPLKTKTLAELL